MPAQRGRAAPSPPPTRGSARRGRGGRSRRAAAPVRRARGAKSAASSGLGATRSSMAGSRPGRLTASPATGRGSPTRRPAGAGGGGAGRPGNSPADSEDSICPICRTQITNLSITNCNHRFCRECISQWTERNGTCPSCRQNIHTIRTILPDGATEIIQISRAELVAHKVNEIYSILILLFNVMSHSLLPEVANYLEQLNEIARELNIPTTSSRTGRMAEEAERAAAEAPTSGASSSAGSSSNNSTPPASSAASTATSSPSSGGLPIAVGSILFGRRRASGATRGGYDSDDEASTSPNEPPVVRGKAAPGTSGLLPGIGSSLGSSSGSNSGSSAGASESRGAAEPAAAGKTAATGAGQAAKSTQSAGQSQVAAPAPAAKESVVKQPVGQQQATKTTTSANQPSEPQQQQAASIKSLSTSTGLSAPAATMGSASSNNVQAARLLVGANGQPLPLYRIRIGGSEDSGYSSAPAVNARIRHTYQTANQHQASQSTGSSIGSSAAASASRASPSANISSRPPTAEEARRTHEQRQRDIRFLSESYNKINQVYEVLMIMHMVIHRNQVDLEQPSD